MLIFKKIFFLSLFFFVLAGLFWGVYNLSFRKAEVEKIGESGNEMSGGIEKKIEEINVQEKIEAEKKIAVISEEAVISPVLSQDGENVQYFLAETGEAVAVDFFGKNKNFISTAQNLNLEKALWTFDRSQIMLKIKNANGATEFFLKDLRDNSFLKIRDNIDEISWQTGINRILYKYYEEATGGRSLNVADANGKNWQKIADIGYRNVSIAQIPKTSAVSFWNSPDAYSPTIFTSVPIMGGEVKTLLKDFFGADYLWDPNGEKALVSHSDQKGGNKIQLGMINYNGGEYRNLNIPTFVSKTVWSKNGKFVYYGLPGGISEFAVLPNEYNEKKITTTDTFWKINIETGEKTRLVETDEIEDRYDASELFLNENESLLFFVNRVDGKLYKLTL